MKKITMYQTNDGKLFRDEKEAITHEELLQLRYEWYVQDPLFDPHGNTVYWMDLVDWVDQNRERVMELLEILKK